MAWVTTVRTNEELVIDGVTTLRFEERTRVRIMSDKTHSIEKRPRLEGAEPRVVLPARKVKDA